MLTPDVRPEERIQPSSVMVRSDQDTNRLMREHTQNHSTLDHTFFEHAEPEGMRAAEGETRGEITSTPPPISISEALAAQHHLALIQPVANVLLIGADLREAHAHLHSATQEEMADAQRRVDVILTRLARAATEAVATPQHDGERSPELHSTARGLSPSSLFTTAQIFAARDFSVANGARDARVARLEYDARDEHGAGGDGARNELRDAAHLRHAYAARALDARAARGARGWRDSHGTRTTPLPRAQRVARDDSRSRASTADRQARRATPSRRYHRARKDTMAHARTRAHACASPRAQDMARDDVDRGKSRSTSAARNTVAQLPSRTHAHARARARTRTPEARASARTRAHAAAKGSRFCAAAHFTPPQRSQSRKRARDERRGEARHAPATRTPRAHRTSVRTHATRATCTTRTHARAHAAARAVARRRAAPRAPRLRALRRALPRGARCAAPPRPRPAHRKRVLTITPTCTLFAFYATARGSRFAPPPVFTPRRKRS